MILASTENGASIRNNAAFGPFGRLRAVLLRKRMARAERLLRGLHPQRALRRIAGAARRGDAAAKATLGRCYLEGIGVPRSAAEASFWLGEAAHQGVPEAQFLLASLCLHGLASDVTAGHQPNSARAAYWVRQAAETGLAEAQALLGKLILLGKTEPLEADEAARLLRSAAEQNCPQGHLGYALHLTASAATPADWIRVRHHAERAAEAGLPSAVHFLAVLTGDSRTGSAEPERALALLRNAADAGLPAARQQLGLALLAPDRSSLDRDEGLHWLRLAARTGDGVAARSLAELLLAEGSGIRQPAEAARWLRTAVDAGDHEAACDLARLVLTGEAGGEDADLVRDWFARAAQAGDLRAAYNYAVCLARGIGGPPDGAAALPWLARAAPAIPEADLWYRLIQDSA